MTNPLVCRAILTGYLRETYPENSFLFTVAPVKRVYGDSYGEGFIDNFTCVEPSRPHHVILSWRYP
jgi:hypothetical protein